MISFPIPPKTLLALPLLAAFCLLPAAAQDVDAIVEKHLSAMIEDLRAYIEANPGAEDREQAGMRAVRTAAELGHTETVLELLSGEIDRGLALNPVAVGEVAGIAKMAADYASSHGHNAYIRTMLEKLRDIPEIRQSPMFINAENEMKQMLTLPGIGDEPELSGTTVDGEAIQLEDYRGKVVLLDFWATWCPPCMEELPNMKATYDKFHEQGFEIIGISADRNRAALEGVLDESEIAWPNLYDREQDGSLVEQFNIQAFPTLLLLDRDGVVVAKNPRGPELEKAVAAQMESKEP